jgi:hypothetical protein
LGLKKSSIDSLFLKQGYTRIRQRKEFMPLLLQALPSLQDSGNWTARKVPVRGCNDEKSASVYSDIDIGSESEVTQGKSESEFESEFPCKVSVPNCNGMISTFVASDNDKGAEMRGPWQIEYLCGGHHIADPSRARYVLDD